MVKRDLILESYFYEKDRPGSLPNNPVNSIFEDSQGNLWVGNMEGGLNMKPRGSNSFLHYKHSNFHPHSLSHNSVSAITEDNQERLWIATWGRGLNRIDLNQKGHHYSFTYYETQTTELRSNFIGCLAYDSINNGLWIGTLNGLHFYDFTHDHLKAIPLSLDKYINNSMVGMLIDSRSRLWVGTSRGLLIVDLLSFARSHSDFTYQFLENKLDQPGSRQTEKINCIYEDNQGTIWLGSHGYGLYQLISEENNKFEFVSFTTRDGLSNNSIFGILEDDNNNLWLSTNHGLSCYHIYNRTFTNFYKSDGILSNQFYWNAYCRSKIDGTLYFGNLQGLIGIQDIQKRKRTIEKEVVLTKLLILNETILPHNNRYLDCDISCAGHLSLHERDKSFSIEFSALDFENTPKIRYAYRLKGFDKEWIPTDHERHFASYTNLNPGKYIFQVKVEEEENNEPVIRELSITVQPFFYKTWWFYSFITFLIMVGITSFYLWRISSLEKQKEILTQKVKSRTHELENKTIELSRQNLVLTEQYEK